MKTFRQYVDEIARSQRDEYKRRGSNISLKELRENAETFHRDTWLRHLAHEVRAGNVIPLRVARTLTRGDIDRLVSMIPRSLGDDREIRERAFGVKTLRWLACKFANPNAA